MEIVQPAEEQAPKKGRHRKKLLYNSILQQMEFYFSDSNLCKERFLSQLIQDDPFVDITLFLKFNKIRKLTTNIEDITKALSKSEILELSEDKTKVRRTTPIKVKQNEEDCTIYVERIKADATHEWLSAIFSEYGNVVYISIPKYRHNKSNKGFAFIEFEKEREAKQALEYFDSIGCKISAQMAPEELCSIVTFEDKNDQQQSRNGRESEGNEKEDDSNNCIEKVDDSNSCNKNVDDANSRNEKVDNSNSCSEREVSKKRKRSSDAEGETKKSKANDVSANLNDADNPGENEDGEDKKKKKSKKIKKKNLKDLGLQVLSKYEWRKMRNRYLEMQKKKMKQLKQYLNKKRFNSRIEDCKQKTYVETDNVPNSHEESETAKETKLEFVQGVIVKVQLPEPCYELKKAKSELKSCSSEIKYIDFPLPSGSEEAYLRFADNGSAQKFCASEYNGKCTLLEGEEEKMYWQKIENDRSAKFKKEHKKQRGRDKLLKKAEKELGKHIKFDDAD